MTRAILVTNIKGGTGKSTVTEALSKRLRDEGHKTGILDADIDSANLSSRLGVDEKVSFKGDHTIEPVEHEGMELYSMENTFEKSSFSQSGEFMKTVVRDMINHADWGDLDYLVVDCPPGSSDIFEELVRALRPNMLGAISVGIPDAVEDTNRLVKVCNHDWVPILGFIENMSGVYCHNEEVSCEEGDFSGHAITPFGKGQIEEYSEQIGGNFFGSIPLCGEDTDILEVTPETFDNAVAEIEDATEREGWPKLPEDNIGDERFIKTVWKTVKAGISRMNDEFNVNDLQNKFGVEGREPLIIEIELTDAQGLSSILSEVIITVDGGDIKPLNPVKARGVNPDGGIKITSQDLFDAIRGEKKVMRSVTGEIITQPDYSIVDAVRMGDAEIWGERTINRLAVLDKMLTEVVDMEEVSKIAEEV